MRKPFKQVQHAAIDTGFLDLLGEQKAAFSDVAFEDTVNTLGQLALQYVSLITEKIEQKDVASSGKLSDSIEPTTVELSGTVYTVGIKAKDYASYQDEGVNGWAINRDSQFSFKTKGVDPKGKMVKSIRDWLRREGDSASNVKVGISKRERQGGRIQDRSLKRAVSIAYLIKRHGIKPTRFWQDATREMEVYVENELGASLRIDIINNITKL